jgi:succinate dehydrogenase / fumarate reductase membrane anchor subunit
MKSKNKTLQTKLGAVRGLGSAKNGTGHWMAQRATALFLIPLVGMLLLSFMCHVVHGDYEATYMWLHRPVVGGIFLMFLATGFYHGALGMQVVIEDYIHAETSKMLIIVAMKFFAALFFILGALAILRIQLTDMLPHA